MARDRSHLASASSYRPNSSKTPALRATAKSSLLVCQWTKPRRWSESACFGSSVNAFRQRSSAGPYRLDKKWRVAASNRSVGERFVLLRSLLLNGGRRGTIVDVLWN